MAKVVCAIDDSSLPCDDMDVLVLPEGVAAETLRAVSGKLANCLVIGAAREGSYMRAYALLRGKNLIDYLKIGTDGRSTGTGFEPKSAVLEVANLAVGILVCMDVDHDYRLKVREALRNSARDTKLLCVPADMEHSWFSSPPVLGFQGLNLAMSNNNVTYSNPNDRAKSVIAGPDGGWISRQIDCEPIVANVA